MDHPNYQTRPSNPGPSPRSSYNEQWSRSSNYHGPSQYYSNQSSSRGNAQSSSQFYPNGRSYSRGTDIDAEEQQYLSRQLSSILRHRARDMKLHIDSGGFVAVDEILRLPNFRDANSKVIETIVEKDSKQRFHLKTDEKSKRMFIRANQGHSLKLENLDLREIFDASEYPTVLHGTYYENWKKIRTQGLKTMQRNHIHFAADMPGSSGVISGMRQSCEIIVYLNLEKALKDGIKFYISSNNVILSPGNEKYMIEPQYFEKAVDYVTQRNLSLTEPVETGPTKSSNISERVALREAGKKPDGKSNNYPPGYNPVDDTSSEKADKKKKKKKKKDKMQNNTAEQEGKNMKASKKQKSDIIESEQEKNPKLKSSYEITSAVNVDQKDEDEEEEAVKKSKCKQKKKKSKQEFSNPEDEEKHVTEEQDTVESENDKKFLKQFDPTLEQELLKMDKIAVLAQSKILAVGNMDKLIVFDKEKEEDNVIVQKIMNNNKSIKLITQTTSSNMKDLDIKKFQKVLDLSILYNEMNEKPFNGDVRVLYEKSTKKTSKCSGDIEIQSENLKIDSNHRKAALFVWQAFELYKYYEERLNQEIQKKIFKSSLEALKRKMSSNN
ncbi:uncharacterized protein LOC115217608 [Octopus sinensis]|uniref:2'-phosphotransferase n=1 Tax=Octopus sinensis TaxID=2607531 RepID=A0A6P7SYI6_9MOLL|nr:uncharacterized protein LOC115217608 [Octopus sinensis]